MSVVREFFISHPLPSLLVVGGITLAGFYLGKSMRFLRLPSIVGFMIVGVILGPGLVGVVTPNLQSALSFVTEIALAFVAVSIGLELSFSELKRQGRGIVWIIIAESLSAFVVVTAAVLPITVLKSVGLTYTLYCFTYPDGEAAFQVRLTFPLCGSAVRPPGLVIRVYPVMPTAALSLPWASRAYT